jgi:hypothetical protein
VPKRGAVTPKIVPRAGMLGIKTAAATAVIAPYARQLLGYRNFSMILVVWCTHVEGSSSHFREEVLRPMTDILNPPFRVSLRRDCK